MSASGEPGAPVRDLVRLRAWEIGFGVFGVAASLTNLISLTTRVEDVPPEVRWWTFVLFVGFAALPVVVLLGWRAGRIVGYGVGRLVMQPSPRRR